MKNPTGVTALFDAPGASLSSFGKGYQVETPTSVAAVEPAQPRDDLARRARARHAAHRARSRSVASPCLLSADSARSGCSSRPERRTDTSGSLCSANGTVVGVVGAILGFVLGLVVWLAYRPSLEQSSHHVIGALALSWTMVVAAMVLAVVAAFFAASRPARAITKVPIVAGTVGPTGASSSDPPVRAPRHRLARPRVPPARLLRWHEPREWKRRGSRARVRHRSPHPRAHPARAVLPVVDCAPRPPCADRDPARAARSRPVPGALGLGARGDQRRGARRGDRHARRRRPLRQRPRLRRPEPGVERACTSCEPAAAGSADCEAQCQRSTRSGQEPSGGDRKSRSARSVRRADRERARRTAHRPRDAGRRIERDTGRSQLERTDLRRNAAAPQSLRDQAVRDRSERGHLELAAWPFWRLGPRLQLRIVGTHGPDGGSRWCTRPRAASRTRLSRRSERCLRGLPHPTP